MEIHLSQEGYSFEEIKAVFSLPEAQGRTDDWFRIVTGFIHYPCLNHPENIDSGLTHGTLSRLVYGLLNKLSGKPAVDETLNVFSCHFAALLGETRGGTATGFLELNLFELFRPAFLTVFYRLLFDHSPDPEVLKTLVKSNRNFHYAMKGAAVPNHRLRRKVYAWIEDKLKSGRFVGLAPLYEEHGLSDQDKAGLLGGVFFDTAVVQMVDLLTHTLIEVSRNPQVESTLMETAKGLSSTPHAESSFRRYPFIMAVLNESLRIYPLFGNTNRLSVGRFSVGGRTIDAGTHFYLNFKHLQARALPDGTDFKPERWLPSSPDRADKPREFCPFGLGPRRCPAQALSLDIASAALVKTMELVKVEVPDDLVHTRRLFRGAPAWVAARRSGSETEPSSGAPLPVPHKARRRIAKRVMRQYDIGDTFIWHSPLQTLRIVTETMWQQRRVEWVAIAPLIITARCLYSIAASRVADITKRVISRSRNAYREQSNGARN